MIGLFSRFRQIDALIRKFRWSFGEPAYATFTFCDGKGWIKQLVDLLDRQIFNRNGIARKVIGRWRGAKAKLDKFTNSGGADRAMSFRPGIDFRGQSFRHPYRTDGIAARPRIGRVVRRFLGEVGNISKSANQRASPSKCMFSRFSSPGNLILINDYGGTSGRRPWVMPAGLVPQAVPKRARWQRLAAVIEYRRRLLLRPRT